MELKVLKTQLEETINNRYQETLSTMKNEIATRENKIITLNDEIVTLKNKIETLTNEHVNDLTKLKRLDEIMKSLAEDEKKEDALDNVPNHEG